MNFKIINYLVSIIFSYLLFTSCDAQDSITKPLTFDLDKVFEPYTIVPDSLNEAQTISDLNIYFKSSWVKKYYSVDITTKQGGVAKTSSSKNDTLTFEQIKCMNDSDLGSDILIRISYVPNNKLKNNEDKEYKFKIKVGPNTPATFLGGKDALNSYLQENVINNITSLIDEDILVAVKFNIDESGQVSDAIVSESTGNEETDKFILEALCNMPRWQPATFVNGTSTIQEFVFLLGNLRSCKVNTYNFKPVR